MKVINIQDVGMEDCVMESQSDGVLITRDGLPVAFVVGVEGMDIDQVELCQSANFWSLIRERRSQPTLSRAELDKRFS